LTTLDSATRLLRFNIEEIGASFGIAGTQNRYVSSILACGVIAMFATYEIEVDGPDGVIHQPAGLALWQLFGTTNQLLAGLTLVLATLYCRARQRPTWPTGLPAIAMLASTLTAMVINLAEVSDRLLLTVGTALLLLGIAVLFESVIAVVRPLRSS
jgi:carbon starvation protein